MVMVGFPMLGGATTAGAWSPGVEPGPWKARPATTAPATAAPMIRYLRLWLEVKPDEDGSLSLMYCVLMVPARILPLAAVIRTSTVPGVLFHCMPQTEAFPSALVI